MPIRDSFKTTTKKIQKLDGQINWVRSPEFN